MKTGLAPARTIAPAVAKNVKGVVITSSPGPTPAASRAICIASLPLAQPIPKFTLLKTAISFSSFFTFYHKIKFDELITSSSIFNNSGFKSSYCSFPSTIDIFI